MKFLKLAMLSTFLFAIMSFNSIGQTFLKWNHSTDFVIGTSSSSLLDDADKFDQSGSSPSCLTPQQTLCGFEVNIVSGSPMPTEQQILDAVKVEYDRLAGLGQLSTFANNYTFQVTIGSVTISIKVLTKQNAI